MSVSWDWMLSSCPSILSISIPSSQSAEPRISILPRSKVQVSFALSRVSLRNFLVAIFSPMVESPGIVSTPFSLAEAACSLILS